MKSQDTIAAISTPQGEGGIGIIRLSGKDAVSIIQKIFSPSRKKLFIPKTHTLSYGHIIEPATKKIVDEVLIAIMLSPNSYTKEDVVEINCHGGLMPLNETLRIVLDEGSRLAEPGEFTKRAFLNGRIDLSQAEAVIDIIRSKTDKGMKLAQNQLEGKISKEVNSLRDMLINILAQIELNSDFIEDDVEIISNKEAYNSLIQIIEKVDKLLAGASVGKIIRDGIKIAIAGKPNVGKSSLLNTLLNEERAIVTHFPGTTRDIIEEVLDIKGIPAVIVDTAGIRHTTDEIEKIGIERSIKAIHQADIILCVLDINEPLNNEDFAIIDKVKGKKTIFVLNKIDKIKNPIIPQNLIDSVKPKIKISAVTEEGLEDLKNAIYNLIIDKKIDSDETIFINNLRHEQALKNAKNSLNKACTAINEKLSFEFIAFDVKEACDFLGNIIGKTYSEDILNHIFSHFCIGK